MIADIPSSYSVAVNSQHYLCAQAMVDSFYVHVRLLADFLVRKTKKKDFGPTEFAPAWEPPELVEVDKLWDYWDVSSKYVSHFSRDRTSSNLGDLDAFRVDAEWFAQMARDVLTVAGFFIKAVEDRLPPASDGSDLAKLLRERAVLLRRAYDEGCEKLGLT